MIEVTNRMNVYEVNGKRTGFTMLLNNLERVEREELIVKSHWNNEDWIVIIYKGKSVTVLAKDIILAAKNATNVVRY